MMGFFEGMGLNTYVVSFLARFNFGDGAHTLHVGLRYKCNKKEVTHGWRTPKMVFAHYQ